MISVLVAFDNINHQPKLTNMISMLQDQNSYSIQNSFVDDVKQLIEIYKVEQPDVILIDTKFNNEDTLAFFKDFYDSNKNGCKLVCIYKDKKERFTYANTKIPARFFPSRVSSDILFYSFNELTDFKLNRNNEKINKLIKDLGLNLSSPLTKQFKDCLEILTNEKSKYLLYGYVYNAFYTTSKLENLSFDTIRKSVYKVKENINANISPTLKHSVFYDNDINSMNVNDFFEFIVAYLDE